MSRQEAERIYKIMNVFFYHSQQADAFVNEYLPVCLR